MRDHVQFILQHAIVETHSRNNKKEKNTKTGLPQFKITAKHAIGPECAGWSQSAAGEAVAPTNKASQRKGGIYNAPMAVQCINRSPEADYQNQTVESQYKGDGLINYQYVPIGG